MTKTQSNYSAFNGNWYDLTWGLITVLSTDGVNAQVTYLNGRGPFHGVIANNGQSMTVNFTDDSGNITGTLINNGFGIQWSNNTTWNLLPFMTTGGMNDFAENPTKQSYFTIMWNKYLDGFTQQGMAGDQWNSINQPAITNYYNPANTIPSAQPTVGNVEWSAFPGRLSHFYPGLPSTTYYQMGDNGPSSVQIPSNPCNPSAGPNVYYYPYGPRGWQDEYSEWSVTRNSAGKIIRIDFTCDNPEYINCVWNVDPNKVVEIYQNALDNPSITLSDLVLTDSQGNVPTNPTTNQPYYNPLNKWNSGTQTVLGSNGIPTSGGAMHLTSTPNTIQTEVAIATAATVLRIYPEPSAASNPTTGQSGQNTIWRANLKNDLLCDAQYGQKYRNSDPSIGIGINQTISNNGGNSNTLTIKQPLGLYIQMPDFTNFKYPSSYNGPQPSISSFWTIKRGAPSLNDKNGNPILNPNTNQPANFITHAVFEIPASLGLDIVIGDLLVRDSLGDGSYIPLQYGSQVANTYDMQILVDVAPTSSAALAYGFAAANNTNPTHEPVQLFYKNYFDVMSTTTESNPNPNLISLLSNSSYVPIHVTPGNTYDLVLTSVLATVSNLSVYFTDAQGNVDTNLAVTIVNSSNSITYAVPGNTMPASYNVIEISVTVNNNASQGMRNVCIVNSGQTNPIPMPCLMYVD